MLVRTEVVHMVDGRLFDSESYDRTDALHGPCAGEPGYYVVLWAREPETSRGEGGAHLIGPFRSAQIANLAASDLQVVREASEPAAK